MLSHPPFPLLLLRGVFERSCHRILQNNPLFPENNFPGLGIASVSLLEVSVILPASSMNFCAEPG